MVPAPESSFDVHCVQSEIKEEIIGNMNIQERSTLRKTSETGRILADTLPYRIEALYISLDSQGLQIEIHEPNHRVFLPKDTQITELCNILDNPTLTIGKIHFFAKRGVPGAPLIHQMAHEILENGIEKASLHVDQFIVSFHLFSGERNKNRVGRSDIGIKEMLEFCRPVVLNIIKIDIDFIDLIWTDMVKTAQYKQARVVDVYNYI
ncbi:hypothetical protein CRE_21177 [Caenorhabditis remanei]|uniref:DUF38 domain-containing protein n=1 Tax=Caenorhabditis remanei TaxID=31234 RepID=E3MF67_CAERE|nr:hypothetical protein CRE_21177 [Caenorhabditis remanei]